LKDLKIYLASWILYLVVRVLALTYRIRFFAAEHREAAQKLHPRGSFCLALWHEQLFAGILAHRKMPFAPLASLSKDGDIVTFVMDRFGFRTVRGSSSRGGPEARDGLVAITDEGWFTAITVDGPKGPRRRVKGGIVDVARRSGVAIVPMCAVADRQWVLTKSWDQFKIPKPFARIAVAYGEPIPVPPDTQGLAFGEVKNRVKAGLDQTEARAGEELGSWHA
jgi:lysophospholipid acyltransferase (LPLAT)-like uncharacterized protein